MSQRFQQNQSRRTPRQAKRRSPLILILLLTLWSLILGWGLAFAIQPPTLPSTDPLTAHLDPPVNLIKAVDPPSSRYQLGEELYLENCATCHIPIPPAVLPTETWRDLLQDADHYSVQIQPLTNPTRALVWNYIKTYSRLKLPDEITPYRLASSRLFKALHPDVEFSTPINLGSCVTCHPKAEQFNYRTE